MSSDSIEFVSKPIVRKSLCFCFVKFCTSVGRRLMALSSSISLSMSSLVSTRRGGVSKRGFAASASADFANENREFVIVGGGNAAGYAAREFVEHGMAHGRLCIVSKEACAPYERPALMKGYLFPHDKKPSRLPAFHTCVGAGGERQTPEWYTDKGIEMIYEDPVTETNFEKQTLTTESGKVLKYGSLIIVTGCTASRFPEGVGGNLLGVHFIREVVDADSLVSSLTLYVRLHELLEKRWRKHIKLLWLVEDTLAWRWLQLLQVGNLTPLWGFTSVFSTHLYKLLEEIVFPGEQILPRLFTSSLAQKYEALYRENGVNFVKGVSIRSFEAGSNGRVNAVKLENGSTMDADTVNGQFKTNAPGVFAIGDVAPFPLKLYDRMARVEHVDHARRSALHCIRTLLTANTHTYDYLPYFYSRVFEQEGSSRKIWWQFFGDNVGEPIEIGKFDPKIATFWIESGKLKGLLVGSGSTEELELLPKLARSQPFIDITQLQSTSSVEEALEVARASLLV